MLLSSAPHASSGGSPRAAACARDLAAGAAQHERPAHDRVVRAGLDRPVVDEEAVRDPGQPLQRILVAVRDRLVGHVAARQHERHAGVAEQEVVQRRVRQHHAEVGVRGRDRLGDRRPGPPPCDHDRAVAARQSLHLGRREVDERAGAVQVERHQRERPVLAPLARAQRGDRDRVPGAAREVVAAEPLDRDDRAVEQRRRGGRDRIAGGERAAAGVEQRRMRAAGRAGVRLGVEAAVERVVVLRPAGCAHREAGHRRARAVVGDSAHDREPRAAVGAVDERVAVAAVAGVAQLVQARVAGRAVGGDRRSGGAARGAGHDRELTLADRRQRPVAHALDGRERRRLARQPGQEALDRVRRALDLEQHPALVVADPAAEPLVARQPVHVRAEADALDRALHAGAHPAHDGPSTATRLRKAWYALACASWIRGMCSERVTTTWSASRSAATRPPS